MKLSQTTRRRSLFVGAFVAVVATVALAIGGIMAFSTDNTATPPATSKTLTDNGDGTYNLNLSVTGSASSSTTKTKANVVIVMDTSGSMNFNAESATGRYGSDDQGKNTYQLYRLVSNPYQHYVALTDDTYTGDVYYADGWGYYPYNGTRFSTKTRLDVAKSATTSLVNTLASNNTQDATDTVEITLETFNEYANTNEASYSVWYSGTDMSGLTSLINGLSADGGTNWDDALDDATSVALKKNDGDSTHYIFVSDGDPTYHMNQYGDRQGTGSSTSQADLDAAYADADTIKTDGFKFYGVGVFGTVANMETLSHRAGGAYYSATDQETLNKAFAEIISSITDPANFQNVKITDGITTGTSSTVLQEGSGVTDYTYTITDIKNNLNPHLNHTVPSLDLCCHLHRLRCEELDQLSTRMPAPTHIAEKGIEY